MKDVCTMELIAKARVLANMDQAEKVLESTHCRERWLQNLGTVEDVLLSHRLSFQ